LLKAIVEIAINAGDCVKD